MCDTGTHLGGWPFSVTANLQDDGQWLLEGQNSEHNHLAGNMALGHPVHRHLESGTKQWIVNMTAALTSTNPFSLRLEMDQAGFVSARDVYYARANIPREALGSRTPIKHY